MKKTNKTNKHKKNETTLVAGTTREENKTYSALRNWSALFY